MPLDPGTSEGAGNVHVVGEFGNGDVAVQVVGHGQGERVSHFATCPNASAHRKSKR